MSPMVGIHDLFGLQPRTLGWIQFVLGTPVVLWVGWPILRKFWLSLTHRALNMYTLIGLGVGLAYLYSLAAVLAPGWFPPEFREHDGAVGTYFEAAAVIVTLVILGDFLQLRAMGQTSKAIQQLLQLAPNLAWRLRDDGSEEQVPLDTGLLILQLPQRAGSKQLEDPRHVGGTLERLLPGDRELRLARPERRFVAFGRVAESLERDAVRRGDELGPVSGRQLFEPCFRREPPLGGLMQLGRRRTREDDGRQDTEHGRTLTEAPFAGRTALNYDAAPWGLAFAPGRGNGERAQLVLAGDLPLETYHLRLGEMR